MSLFANDHGVPADPAAPRAATVLRALLNRLRGAAANRRDEQLEYARMSRAGYRPRRAPEQTEAGADLAARVRELTATGAVDEGSGDIFDPIIEAWSQQWATRLAAEHDARISYLRYREVHADARASLLDRRLAWSRGELRSTERHIEDLERRLGMAPAPDHATNDDDLSELDDTWEQQ